jgi:NDP-sugar pyrophosphorylase family protein
MGEFNVTLLTKDEFNQLSGNMQDQYLFFLKNFVDVKHQLISMDMQKMYFLHYDHTWYDVGHEERYEALQSDMQITYSYLKEITDIFNYNNVVEIKSRLSRIT